MAHSCNLSTWETKAEDHKFKANLSKGQQGIYNKLWA